MGITLRTNSWSVGKAVVGAAAWDMGTISV